MKDPSVLRSKLDAIQFKVGNMAINYVGTNFSYPNIILPPRLPLFIIRKAPIIIVGILVSMSFGSP